MQLLDTHKEAFFLGRFENYTFISSVNETGMNVQFQDEQGAIALIKLLFLLH